MVSKRSRTAVVSLEHSHFRRLTGSAVKTSRYLRLRSTCLPSIQPLSRTSVRHAEETRQDTRFLVSR